MRVFFLLPFILLCQCGYFESVINPVESTPATLTGRVADSLLRKGLPGAGVVLSGERDTAVSTDGTGYFSFPISTTGNKRLSVTFPGYCKWSGEVDLKASGNALDTIFMVFANHPPVILNVVYPPAHAANMPLMLSFRWVAGDADLGVTTSLERLRYWFHFGPSNPPPAVDSGTLALAGGLPYLVFNEVPYFFLDKPDSLFALEASSRYYWKIVVRDALNDSDVYPLDSFTTRNAFDSACPPDMKLVEMETLSFCMDRYEMTNEDYKQFDTAYMEARFSTDPRDPATDVLYSNAQAACVSKGKRLCHIREWQAASGGYKRLKYPYGDEYDSSKCHTGIDVNNSPDGETREVGSMDSCVSPYGIFDLSGNVAEWVAPVDTFSTYDGHHYGCVLNYYSGGYWMSQDKSGTFDLYCSCQENSWDIGFRCCKSLK
ncbi:MAG: SUMF1/EgtB/PvdO family nonheme iron enzyme [Methanoregulaceae archaeon]|nr:SUMF1/EgtB/PvdO family nonheme iron enzyme [Methanoregulaceae archaeon]